MRKKSALEKEVTKQLQRIKRAVKRAEQQGFTFPKSPLPKIPARVTAKTVERLKKITPTDLYKKAKYTIPETGKVISGSKARELIKSKAREKRIVEQAIKKETAKIQRQMQADIARQTKERVREYEQSLRSDIRNITSQANKEIRKISRDKALPQETKNMLIASIEARKQSDIEERQREIESEKSSKIELLLGEIQERTDTLISSRRQAITDAPQIYVNKANIEAEKRKAKREAKKQEQDRLNEVTRIKTLIETIKETYTPKKGYLFPKAYFDKLVEKADSLTIDELRGITEESILAEDTTKFKDPLTGTIFSGSEGRKIEQYRDEISGKYGINYNTNANESDSVLGNLRDLIANWTPSAQWTDWFSNVKENDKNVLERMLEGAIAEEGEAVVAQRCQDNATYVLELAQSILYESGGDEKDGRSRIQFDLAAFHSVITGKSMTAQQAMEYHDLMETYEVL